MQLKNNFWWFEKSVPESFCAKVIKAGFAKNTRLGNINKYYDKKITPKIEKDLKKTRDSNVAFLNDKWIYNEIDKFFKTANHNAGWNFDFDHYESAQFTVYRKGQHYDWHVDANAIPFSPKAHKNYRGKIRKLSATITLNDAKEYKGGELLFDFSTPLARKKIIKLNRLKALRKKGSIIIFPSHLYHKVSPVTKGVRYSLVIWGLGLPWR